MTRFDANEPAQRRSLVAEAIMAHRRRASEATVFEVGTHEVADPTDGPDGAGESDGSNGFGVSNGDDPTGGSSNRGTNGPGADARGERSPTIIYADGVLEIECTPSERERLDELLQDFPVFKIKQPATRKAPDGTVHVSAVADPKHAADFVDAAFRRVYDLPEGYRLWVVRI